MVLEFNASESLAHATALLRKKPQKNSHAKSYCSTW